MDIRSKIQQLTRSLQVPRTGGHEEQRVTMALGKLSNERPVGRVEGAPRRARSPISRLFEVLHTRLDRPTSERRSRD